MGQQKFALVAFDCLIKNYVFALVEYFLNAVGSKRCCLGTRMCFPLFCQGLVCSTFSNKSRVIHFVRGDFLVATVPLLNIGLYKVKLCSLTQYPQYFFCGIGSLEGKELVTSP